MTWRLPHRACVSMMHFDGPDGSTTFIDENNNRTWTNVGNVQLDTAQSVFGGSSLLLDGTGDYLMGTDSPDFDFPSNFIIEFRVRFNAIGAAVFLYDPRPAAGNGLYPVLYAQGSVIKFHTNSADRITGTTTLTTNTWYQIVVARVGTATKLFLNGTQEGSTYTDSNSYINAASRPIIGAGGNSLGASPMNGWLDEFRIDNGAITRFANNFVVPTKAYQPTGVIVRR